MATATSVHAAILAALSGAGLYAVEGPADELPAGADGLVAQACVVYPHRLSYYARMSGGSSGKGDVLWFDFLRWLDASMAPTRPSPRIRRAIRRERVKAGLRLARQAARRLKRRLSIRA